MVAFGASTSDALQNEYLYDLYSEQYPNLNRPYTAPDGEGNVDMATGSLATNVEDYRVEGKNDFDATFVRSFSTNTSAEDIACDEYNSRKSVEDHYEVEYVCAKDGETVPLIFYNEMELMEAGEEFEGGSYKGAYGTKEYSNIVDHKVTTSYTRASDATVEQVYKNKYYRDCVNAIDSTHSFIKLDSTMKISKPAMEIYDWVDEDDYHIGYFIFQDIQGKSTSIEAIYDLRDDEREYDGSSNSPGNNYSNYTLYAVDENNIDATAEHNLGFTYNMYMQGDDGSKYYIMRDKLYTGYEILAAEDRYGNYYKIDITNSSYTLTTPENAVYTCNKTGITKTYNGEVTELVKYTEEDVNNDELDPDELYTADDEMIFTVTKNSSQNKTISEDEENVVRYYMYQDYRYDKPLRQWKELRYYLPYKIEFPSGLEKNIEYSQNRSWNIGFGSGANYGYLYSVSKYSEKVNDDVRNVSEYIYTQEEHETSGRDTSYFSEVEQIVYDGESDEYSIINTYNRKGNLLTNSRYYAYNKNVQSTYEYTGSGSDTKISQVETCEESNNKTAYNTTEYDYLTYHYLTGETNGDYDVSYTYHEDGNYIPHETIYQKDADTEIRIENILTEDKKGIATQNTYENDVLVKTVSYTYDTYGNIASETASIDGTNAIVTTYNYVYAPDGGYTLTSTITGVRDADGVQKPDITTVSVYDSNYNLVSQTDANGNTTTMTYDMLKRPLGITYPDGTTETYSYDIANGITTYTAPNGTVYKAYYDAWGNKIKTTAIVDGSEIQFDEYTYDDLGNIVTYKAFSSDTDFVKAEYTYDYLDRPTSEKIYDEDDTLIKTTTYTYTLAKDAENRPLNTVTATVTGDGGTYASASQTTNYRGFTLESKAFHGTDERTTTYTHDFMGNVLTSTDPDGNVTTTSYDAFGNPLSVTYPDGNVVTTAYNMLGLATDVTDARGNTTEYFYDNAGRNIKVVSPFDDENSSVTKTYYDGNGNVVSTKVLTGGSVNNGAYRTVDNTYNNMNRLDNVAVYPTNTTAIYTRYSYDSLGNPTKVVAGLTSSDASDDDGQMVTYQYDDLGRMICTTTPDGLTETTEYDYLGRVTTSTDKANRETEFSYDAFGNLLSKSIGEESVSYTYNLLGMPTSMTDSTGTTTYVYNPFGELTTETKGDIIKSYTYDNLGRRTAFEVAEDDAEIINQTYTYDIMGRMISTTNGADTLSYTYDANSNLLTKAHNGSVYHTAQYNKANLPVVTQLNNGSEVEDTTQYIYAPDGNLMYSYGTDISSMYYYDGANRLVYENSWTDSSDDIYDYVYDSFGNRTSKVYTDFCTDTVTTTNYTYNNINQLVSQTTGTDTVNYNYDTVGNMTSVTKNGTTEKTYTYDAFNRLATANVNGTTSSYTYNGDNLRQSKTVNGVTTNHIYDGANIVADLGTTDTVFVRGMGLALLKNETTTQVYGINPRGDVAKLMSPDGTATDYTYTAYGEPISENASIQNPFGYTGEYTDAETGLVYLRNRYYDPETGIFITTDPAKDGFNWYAYCAGNPVAFVDPWGLKGVIVISATLQAQCVGGASYGKGVAIDSDFDTAKITNFSLVVGTPGAGLSINFSVYPNMEDVTELEAHGIDCGLSFSGSYGYFSGGFEVDESSVCGFSVGGGTPSDRPTVSASVTRTDVEVCNYDATEIILFLNGILPDDVKKYVNKNIFNDYILIPGSSADTYDEYMVDYINSGYADLWSMDGGVIE